MFIYFTLALLIIFFIANMFSGGGSPRKLRRLFWGNYYAENGVISPEDVPNSKETFEKCIQKQIGIKTAVCITKDRKVVISTKDRIDENLTVGESEYRVLQEKGFMTLSEFLELVDGKVPVIIELIVGDQNERLCRYTADAIIAYGHENAAVATFHSGMLEWFKHTEKHIFRGIISAPAKDFKALSALDKFLVGNLVNNGVCRPHFVLYRNKPESILVKFAYKLGIVKGVWTLEDKEEAKKLEETKDMIIFKNFVPDSPHYKDLGEREKTKLEIDIENRERAKAAEKARLAAEKQNSDRQQ